MYLRARHTSQTGQAMVESLITLAFFLAVMFGAHLTSRMQINALDLLRDTAMQAFRMNQGQRVITDGHRDFSRSVVAAGARELKSFLVPDPILGQLNIHSPGLLKLTSSMKPSRLDGVTALFRQSHIEAGDGHAASDTDVQLRIAQSDRAWRQPQTISHTAVRLVQHGSALIDQPWRRPRVETDWLSKWSGVLPDQKTR